MKNPHREALVELAAKFNRLGLATEGSATRRSYLSAAALVEVALEGADKIADGRSDLSYGPPPFDGGVGCED